MNDIIKIITFLEESGLLIKNISETIKNEAKEQRGGFFRMLLGILDDNLLQKLLTGKDTIIAGEGTVWSGQDFWCCLILWQILKWKGIIRIRPNLMSFIQKIIYLKQTMGHM